ncbi:hypothetical protein LSA36186_16210 [Lachnoanaerobaculum sp. JCM 36186]|uniref:hypothetical protein n=1 Tax=Lachnoanaerobaculum sanguinis TaxID=3065809 RepID=UPI002776D053|nr:hypothetical protein [Lachnoanaerobaculum sp. JCM 36186]GMO03372.1 hypothetical protein LSA36186_16210 [Lachnoanaerobaculum sp. JCM 36186]
MIGVLLAALKIIGIVILAIIALALLIILMVLFIPVRYRGKIYFKEVPDIALSVTWFFKFLSLNITYKDGLDIIGKVGWLFKVYSNRDDEEETDSIEGIENYESEVEENPDTVNENKKLDITVENNKKAGVISGKQENSEADNKIKELDKQEKKQSKKKKNKPEKKKSSAKKESKLDKLINKAKDIHYLLTEEENKKTLLLMLEKTKNLLVHILPKRIVGFFKFGFDDPSTTGQVLEAVAIFYPLYKDDFKIVPMFYDEIIEVDISFKGRLRVFYALYIGLILWLNKKKIKTRPK